MNRHSGGPASDDPRPLGGGGGRTAADTSFVAGYRVLRTLSSGKRSDILLGHSPHGQAGGTVAIKVFRANADPVSVDREIIALGSCAPGCLPRLIDVATLEDGRVVLVMERLGGGTVGSLLDRRTDHLAPGEAVTVIAPVAVALAAVHEIGFVHSALSPGTVTLDQDGRPVLTGLGALCDLPRFGPRDHTTGRTSNSRLDLIRDDYARLAVYMRTVFDHLDRSTTAARQAEFLAAWFEGATSAVPFRPCLDELERRLFEWQPAVAVRREPSWNPPSRDRPGRLALTGPGGWPMAPAVGEAPYEGSTEARRSARVRWLPEWLAVLHLPDDLAPTVERAVDGSPLALIFGRARSWLTRRRRAVIVSGCVATAITVLALTLLPPADRTAHRVTTGPGAPAAEAQPFGGAVPLPSIDATARRAIEGDDPLAAIPHLLAVRSACLATESAGSGECLGASDQADSPILAADLARARESGEEGALPQDAVHSQLVLIERRGDSALVALTPETGADSKPASLLVIKGEAGWRLREIFGVARSPD